MCFNSPLNCSKYYAQNQFRDVECELIISQVCFYAPLDCSAKLIFKMLFLLSACYALTESIKSKAPEWWWSGRADDSHVQQNSPLFFSTTCTFLSSAKLLIHGGSFPSVRLKLWPLFLILLMKCKSAARYRSFCVSFVLAVVMNSKLSENHAALCDASSLCTLQSTYPDCRILFSRWRFSPCETVACYRSCRCI